MHVRSYELIAFYCYLVMNIDNTCLYLGWDLIIYPKNSFAHVWLIPESENLHAFNSAKTDRRMDGQMERQTLLWRWEDAPKKGQVLAS